MNLRLPQVLPKGYACGASDRRISAMTRRARRPALASLIASTACRNAIAHSAKPIACRMMVAQNPIEKGTDTLTPVESVQVWFEQDVVTGTMFSLAKSNVAEINLTTTNTATWLYTNGSWTIPAN